MVKTKHARLVAAAASTLLGLFTLAGTSTAAGIDANATPEQVTDLYIRVFVQSDLEAGAQLNQYYKMTRIDLDAFKTAKKSMTEKIAEAAKQFAASAPAADRDTVQRAFVMGTEAIDQGLANSKCHATKSKIEANDALGHRPETKDAKIATVTFQCDVPAIRKESSTRAKNSKSAKSQLEASQMIYADLSQPKQWNPVTGEFKLYRNTAKEPWNNLGDMNEFSVVRDSIGKGMQ